MDDYKEENKVEYKIENKEENKIADKTNTITKKERKLSFLGLFFLLLIPGIIVVTSGVFCYYNFILPKQINFMEDIIQSIKEDPKNDLINKNSKEVDTYWFDGELRMSRCGDKII